VAGRDLAEGSGSAGGPHAGGDALDAEPEQVAESVAAASIERWNQGVVASSSPPPTMSRIACRVRSRSAAIRCQIRRRASSSSASSA